MSLPSLEASGGEKSGKAIEERLQECSLHAKRAIEDLLALSRDLLSTEEGHEFIRKKVEEAAKKYDERIVREYCSHDDTRDVMGEGEENTEKRIIKID